MIVVFTVDIAFHCKTLQWKKKRKPTQLNSTTDAFTHDHFLFVIFYISICYVGVLGDNKSTPLTSQRSELGTDSTQEDKNNRTTNRNCRMQSMSEWCFLMTFTIDRSKPTFDLRPAPLWLN